MGTLFSTNFLAVPTLFYTIFWAETMLSHMNDALARESKLLRERQGPNIKDLFGGWL